MEITLLRFQDLLGEGTSGDDLRLTQGQMLLLGLNGLFEKMETSLLNLKDLVQERSSIEIFDTFMKPLMQAHKLVVINLILYSIVFQVIQELTDVWV